MKKSCQKTGVFKPVKSFIKNKPEEKIEESRYHVVEIYSHQFVLSKFVLIFDLINMLLNNYFDIGSIVVHLKRL